MSPTALELEFIPKQNISKVIHMNTSFLSCYAYVSLLFKNLFLRVISHSNVRMFHCLLTQSLPWSFRVFPTKLPDLSSKTYCLGADFGGHFINTIM